MGSFYTYFLKKGGKFGFIDQTGKLDILVSTNKGSTGLAAVKLGEKWGYINKTGQYIVKPRFIPAWNFSGPTAVVYLGDDCNQPVGVAIIDRTGKVVGQLPARSNRAREERISSSEFAQPEEP